MATSSTPWSLLFALGAAVALFALSRSERGQLVTTHLLDRLMSARGLRNNNPGNLRRTQIPWRGKITTPEQAAALQVPFDADYEQFTAAKWGVRALARDLRNDYHRDGKRTVHALINEFAPGHENPTETYVAAVARALGVGAMQQFDLERKLPELLSAIIKQENGSQPFRIEELLAWANLS